jgi:hypothetical protein
MTAKIKFEKRDLFFGAFWDKDSFARAHMQAKAALKCDAI